MTVAEKPQAAPSTMGYDLDRIIVKAVDVAMEQRKCVDTSTAFWLKVLAGVATSGLVAAVGLAFTSNERLARVEEGLERVEKLVENGMLPVAAERFSRHDAILADHGRRLDRLEDKK